MDTLQTLGQRQQSLLEALLYSNQGLTVDEIASSLGITRNAVTQHLTNLEGYGFVLGQIQASTGGRPSKRFCLSDAGRELFPRNYALFANLLVRLIQKKSGDHTLRQYMVELGQSLALEYQGQINKQPLFNDRVKTLAKLMQSLGYAARMEINAQGLPEIIANNCVFHQLAKDCDTVCELDIALIATSLGNAQVNHHECIVRGGHSCRFAITENKQ